MPPLRNTRYEYTSPLINTAGQKFLTDRVPLRFVESPDTIVHVVQEGERMEDIAHRYYGRFEKDIIPAASYAWIIRDFQPVPIIDPTLRLKGGTAIYIPSKAFIAQRVFDPRRRDL